MNITKSKISEMFIDGSEIFEVKHKGVSISICPKDDYISIWSIESNNPGKGEVQETIKLLKQRYPNKKFYSSSPHTNAAKHILDRR